MAGMHNRMRAMVIRNLGLQPKGQGSPVTFTKRISGGYDPKTGKTTPVVTQSYTGSAVRVNYSTFAYTNSTIVYGDFQLYLSPVLTDGGETPEPSVGDDYTFLGKKVTVINYSPFNDNGIGCGWKLQVRHG